MAILSCVLNDLTVHHYCNWTGRKVNGSLVSLCIATLLTSQLIYIHFYAHICVRMTMTANCWLRIHEYITITYTKWTQFRSFHIPIAIQWWFSVCETTTEKEIRSTIDANGMHFHRLQFAPAEMQHSHIIHPTSWLSFSFFFAWELRRQSSRFHGRSSEVHGKNYHVIFLHSNDKLALSRCPTTDNQRRQCEVTFKQAIYHYDGFSAISFGFLLFV